MNDTHEANTNQVKLLLQEVEETLSGIICAPESTGDQCAALSILLDEINALKNIEEYTVGELKQLETIKSRISKQIKPLEKISNQMEQVEQSIKAILAPDGYTNFEKFSFKLGQYGSFIALGLVLLMACLYFIIHQMGAEPQPSNPALKLDKVAATLQKAKGFRTSFLIIDMTFIISYLAVFLGFFSLVKSRWLTIAIAALLFGLCSGLADIFENTQLLWHQYASTSITEAGWNLLNNTYAVKWVAAGAAAACFALAWPWRGIKLKSNQATEGNHTIFTIMGGFMCMFAETAIAAGYLDEIWLLIAVLLFLPNLVLANIVFRRILS